MHVTLNGMKEINEVNREFYNSASDTFNKIPFEPLLKNLLLKYRLGSRVLEIGCATGALAEWLMKQGYQIICLEPAEELAKKAMARGVEVKISTLQDFQTTDHYQSVLAFSSLIHIPKQELPDQIQKIASFLEPPGYCIVSFIEGEGEGYEDPTKIGKLRYFSRWSQSELANLFAHSFQLLEEHRFPVPKMDCTFMIHAYQKKPLIFQDAISDLAKASER